MDCMFYPKLRSHAKSVIQIRGIRIRRSILCQPRISHRRMERIMEWVSVCYTHTIVTIPRFLTHQHITLLISHLPRSVSIVSYRLPPSLSVPDSRDFVLTMIQRGYAFFRIDGRSRSRHCHLCVSADRGRGEFDFSDSNKYTTMSFRQSGYSSMAHQSTHLAPAHRLDPRLIYPPISSNPYPSPNLIVVLSRSKWTRSSIAVQTHQKNTKRTIIQLPAGQKSLRGGSSRRKHLLYAISNGHNTVLRLWFPCVRR